MAQVKKTQNYASMPPVSDAPVMPAKKSSCWKIGLIVLGVVVALIIIIIIIAVMATSPIRKVAEDQLTDLKAGDINAAYSLTSNQFKQQTSLAQFQAFVNQYPALKNNKSASFDSSTIENNIGTLNGKLTAIDGTITPIIFKLVKENDAWKILGIDVNPSGGANSNGSPTAPQTTQPVTTTPVATKIISDIKTSDVADAQGTVATNKSVFTASTPEIAVSAYLSGIEKGTEVSAQLMYVQTQETSEAVTNVTQNEGDIVSNFSFSKPASGWPVGDYRLIIVLSTGEKKETTFSVK